MDYAAHYNRLIDRSKDRVNSSYTERHHIVPKCMGGSDENSNIAVLTAEEHFMAHKLLAVIHPHVEGLVYAAVQMSAVGRGQTGRSNNKVYGWLRKKHIKVLAERMGGNSFAKGNTLSQETRSKMSNSKKGHKHSEETKRKIRESNVRTKAKNPVFVSVETREKLSKAGKGRTSAMKGKIHSEETRNKMSASQYKRAAEIRSGNYQFKKAPNV